MVVRYISFMLCALLAVACQDSGPVAGTVAGPTQTLAPPSSERGAAAPGAVPSMAGERPWKAKIQWAVTGIQWAGQPGQDKSTFGGRCSLASDYVITGSFEGEATHAGRFTGSASHCSQVTWGPLGPIGAVYSDGQGVLETANGSTLELSYGSGATGVDPVSGANWFRDSWTFTGGTGLFAGAKGHGEEGGSFMDFNALLAGVPASMWMEGSITYSPSDK